MLCGVCSEPADRLGLARMLAETIDKGSQQSTGYELADAFDMLGASYTLSAGRETTTLACTVLPEHFDAAVALIAEILRTPTFPQDAFEANLQLTRQEQLALDDDAQALTDKPISRRASGMVLGRHALGEPESIEKITRDDLVRHSRSHFHAGRMVVAVVSRFPYLSGKDFDLKQRIPFAFLLLVPLGFVIVGSSPPEMLFGLFGIFALSGPTIWAWRRLTRGRRARAGGAGPAA